MPTHYDTLGLTNEATDREIKTQYNKLALKYHPDKNSGEPDDVRLAAEQRMAEINVAYDILSDKVKREQYDSEGKIFEYLKKAFHVQFFKPYSTPFEPLKSALTAVSLTLGAVFIGAAVLIAGSAIAIHFAFKALILSSDLQDPNYAKLKSVHLGVCAMVLCAAAIVATILPVIYMASLLTCTAATLVSPLLQDCNFAAKQKEAPSAILMLTN